MITIKLAGFFLFFAKNTYYLMLSPSGIYQDDLLVANCNANVITSNEAPHFQ